MISLNLFIGNASGRGDGTVRPGMGRGGMARSLPLGAVQPGGGASFDGQPDSLYEKDLSSQIFEVSSDNEVGMC